MVKDRVKTGRKSRDRAGLVLRYHHLIFLGLVSKGFTTKLQLSGESCCFFIGVLPTNELGKWCFPTRRPDLDSPAHY